MRLMPIIMVLILTLLSINTKAEGFYGVFLAGYVKNDNKAMEVDSPSYKLGIGYQVAPQWYVEAGFQLLAEKNIDAMIVLEEDPQLEASNIYISALGKAIGQSGELFYRMTLMKADLKGRYLSDGTCFSEEHSAQAMAGSVQACSFDDGIFAAGLGLGYDFYVSPTLLLRTEVEHIRGESDYSANALYVGLRVNF